jgi:uncharacterized protein
MLAGRLLVVALLALTACSTDDPVGSAPTGDPRPTTGEPGPTRPTDGPGPIAAGPAEEVQRVRHPGRALLAAAASGDADRAAAALAAGADVETRDDRGRTPLLVAVTRDRLDVARLLLHHGADPDALDDRHDTPWLVTGVTGSVPMAELLLRHDPDLTIRNRYGGVSIIPASERGHVDYVRRVAGTSIDVNHVNDLGWTALLEAIILGDGSRPYVEIVDILLDHGADPDLADADGVTPLEHARARGHDAIARRLTR